ncbi:MAG: IMPACT family protein [Bacillota bacterium]
MRKEYLTIPGDAEAELEEKKSRFIATVKPVTSEKEAQDFIAGLKAKYWKATHNVYAYYIYGDSMLQKFSDDGEPPGTAGLPVLEAVKKLGVQDVAVVVTRYFGGTLLGAAGLARAYGKAAVMGIEAAGIVKMRLCVETVIKMDYSLLGKVQSIVCSKGCKVRDTVYAGDVNMYLHIPVDEYDAFAAAVTEATNAKASVSAGGKTYVMFKA